MHSKAVGYFFCAFLVFFVLISRMAAADPGIVLASLNQETSGNLYLEKLKSVNKATLTFLDTERSENTGLVESFHGSSPYYFDAASNQYYPDKAGILDQQGFTYDLALAIMVYTLNGQFDRAKRMLTIMRDNFYVEKNGNKGLLNSYIIADFNTSEENGLDMGIDGDRIHVGPNMWLALSALQYDQFSGRKDFLPFELDLARWAYDLPHFQFADGSRGAVCMGSGWGPDWSMVFSSENIIDNYAVLKWLEKIYDQADEKVRGIFVQKNFSLREIQFEMACIKKWLVTVGFNPEYQSFNCGYNENGVDQTKALDTVSWGIAALTPGELKQWGLDPFKMVEFAETNFQVRQELNGEIIEGFDFTDEKFKDPNRPRLIWWEGTGQMILMYQVMAQYCRETGDIDRMTDYQTKALKYLKEEDRMSRIAGLPQGVLPYTSIQPKDTEVLNTFFYGWEIPRGKDGRWVTSLASSLWRIIGMTGFNPLVSEQKTAGMLKNIGSEMWARK
jgi:hypothetical protein